MATITERVKAGAVFLDKTYGKKWRRKVKLSVLDMGNANSCILGQTDTDFYSHRILLGLTTEEIKALGFETYTTGHSLPTSYKRLTEAWKQLLRKRN